MSVARPGSTTPLRAGRGSPVPAYRASPRSTPPPSTATGSPATPASPPSTPPPAPRGQQAAGTGSGPSPGEERIRVYVRARGFHKDEGGEPDLAVRMSGATCEVSDPKRGKFPFSFDDCFWSNETLEDPNKKYTSQEDLFAQVGAPLVANAVAGFNSSIIAYGATGSGKTYSVFGPANSLGSKDEGLIPRVCNALFSHVKNPPIGMCFRVCVSLLEVYLEDVFDLLNKHTCLKVRGDTTNGFIVSGLRWVPVSTYDEITELLRKADQLKTYAATALNERSSRAHTIFQVELRAMSDTGTRTSKIVLADLAGCERVKIAKTDTGVPLEQACNINLSLLSLGTCIEAVVARGGRSGAPISEFRNSTLTKLLRDSIGGNSRTAMLVTIAPHVKDVTLTLQALRFADRAKQIQNHAAINSVLNATDEDALAVKANIERLYQQRRELLTKECELELQGEVLRRKQEELERKNLALLEERRAMQDAFATMTEEQKREAAARERAIAEKLAGVEGDLATVQRDRDDLEARYAAVTEQNGEVQRHRERLEQQVRQLTVALEVQSLEHAEELRVAHDEADDLRRELADVNERWAAESAEAQRWRRDAIAREEKLREAVATQQREMAMLRQLSEARALQTMHAAQLAVGAVVGAGSAFAEAVSAKIQCGLEAHCSSAATKHAVLANAVTELHAEKERLEAVVASLRAQLEQKEAALRKQQADADENVLALEERIDAVQRDAAEQLEAEAARHAEELRILSGEGYKEYLKERRAGHQLAHDISAAMAMMKAAMATYDAHAVAPTPQLWAGCSARGSPSNTENCENPSSKSKSMHKIHIDPLSQPVGDGSQSPTRPALSAVANRMM